MDPTELREARERYFSNRDGRSDDDGDEASLERPAAAATATTDNSRAVEAIAPRMSVPAVTAGGNLNDASGAAAIYKAVSAMLSRSTVGKIQIG